MGKATLILFVWVAIVTIALGSVLLGYAFLGNPGTEIDSGLAAVFGSVWGLVLLGTGMYMTRKIDSFM